jgi:hypothetical protein
MARRITTPGLLRALVVFWAAWLGAVAAANLLGASRAAGAPPPASAFASGNWGWVNRTRDPLGVPRALQAVLSPGAVAREAPAAGLSRRAARAYREPAGATTAVKDSFPRPWPAARAETKSANN